MAKRGVSLLVGVVLSVTLAACGSTNPTASASPSSQPSPSVVPSPTPASPTPMSIPSANAQIKATVLGAHPLLLPTTISTTWSAEVVELAPAFFDVIYASPDGTQTIEFAIVVPNPPPPGPNGTQAQPNFHGDSRSLYQVADKTQPAGNRLLMWNEPGSWTMPNGLPGVPYLLTTKGLTDSQFWAVANSIK